MDAVTAGREFGPTVLNGGGSGERWRTLLPTNPHFVVGKMHD